MKLIFFFFPLFLFAQIFEPIEKVQNYDEDVVALGKELFQEPQLSRDGRVSCFSCHFQYGADPRKFSIGVDGSVGSLNAPTVFNATFNFFHHHTGEVKDLAHQFDRPVHDPGEMASSKELIEQRLNQSQKYKELFYQAYGKKPSYELAKDAVVQFQKTLVTPSNFDLYLKGEASLSPIEKKGFTIFKTYGCATCHNGKNLGGNSMQKFGNIIPRIIDGKEVGLLKVPTLRNIEMTAPYFHDGSEHNLKSAIKQMAYHNLGAILSDDEIDALEVFLKTLTGPLPKTWIQN